MQRAWRAWRLPVVVKRFSIGLGAWPLAAGGASVVGSRCEHLGPLGAWSGVGTALKSIAYGEPFILWLTHGGDRRGAREGGDELATRPATRNPLRLGRFWMDMNRFSTDVDKPDAAVERSTCLV